jgi:hypothetical protein
LLAFYRGARDPSVTGTPGHRQRAGNSWTRAAARQAGPSQVHEKSQETRGLGQCCWADLVGVPCVVEPT